MMLPPSFLEINGHDSLAHTPLVSAGAAVNASWTPPSDGGLTLSYQFQIATVASFGIDPTTGKSGLISETDGLPQSNLSILPIPSSGGYFWRVRAFDGILYSQWSAPGSFRMNQPPWAPTNLAVSGV